MNKVCVSCLAQFEIRPEDELFYTQVNTPTPSWCPECRMMRRLSFRNERTLYKRACDLCKKDSVSIYSSETKFPVYCHSCWWSDAWDPKAYATDYDPSRPFMDQFRELYERFPRVALLSVNSVRSEYTNNAGDNKDCYLIFAADGNEDSLYSRLIMKSKQVVDCAFVYDSELCYECIDCRQCFNCLYSEQCQSSTDLVFCYDMRDSQNCIFCTNGRHMTYSIFNKKCTKEEYESKKKEIFSSREALEAAQKEYERIKSSAIVKYAVETKCHNTTGTYMYNCYDGVRLFDVSNAKNTSYAADVEDPIDTQDANNAYYKPELCYELMSSLQCSKTKFSTYVFYCNDIEYCDSSYNLSSGFGCIGVRKGEYMILNKPYEREEFLKLKEEIVASMKRDGSYGEFFPVALSPFGYNESLANDFFPIDRAEAIKRGYSWQDTMTGTYEKETLSEVPFVPEDSLLSEIFACKECKKNFRLTKAEVDFYKKLALPVPEKDFECRHQARMQKRTPRTLWHRSCMCNLSGHSHTERCPNEFETAYSPDRPENIYCGACYNAEIL